jgi:hypothetical protein
VLVVTGGSYNLCLLGRIVEGQAQEQSQEGSYLQMDKMNLPQLQRNQTRFLLSAILHAVHCEEWTGRSQELYHRVRPGCFFDLKLLHSIC